MNNQSINFSSFIERGWIAANTIFSEWMVGVEFWLGDDGDMKMKQKSICDDYSEILLVPSYLIWANEPAAIRNWSEQKTECLGTKQAHMARLSIEQRAYGPAFFLSHSHCHSYHRNRSSMESVYSIDFQCLIASFLP